MHINRDNSSIDVGIRRLQRRRSRAEQAHMDFQHQQRIIQQHYPHHQRHRLQEKYPVMAPQLAATHVPGASYSASSGNYYSSNNSSNNCTKSHNYAHINNNCADTQEWNSEDTGGTHSGSNGNTRVNHFNTTQPNSAVWAAKQFRIRGKPAPIAHRRLPMLWLSLKINWSAASSANKEALRQLAMAGRYSCNNVSRSPSFYSLKNLKHEGHQTCISLSSDNCTSAVQNSNCDKDTKSTESMLNSTLINNISSEKTAATESDEIVVSTGRSISVESADIKKTLPKDIKSETEIDHDSHHDNNVHNYEDVHESYYPRHLQGHFGGSANNHNVDNRYEHNSMLEGQHLSSSRGNGYEAAALGMEIDTNCRDRTMEEGLDEDALLEIPVTTVSWVCSVCTFNNAPGTSFCQVCESDAPDQSHIDMNEVLACGLTVAQVEELQTRDISPEDFQVLLELDEQVPKKTLSKDDVAQFIRVKFVEGMESVDCGVCLCDVEVGEEFVKLPCKHTFHDECITRWLTEYNTKCPFKCNENLKKTK